MAKNVTEEQLKLTVNNQTAGGLAAATAGVKNLRSNTNKMGASFKANAATILAATGSIAAGIFTLKKAFDFADEFTKFQQNQLAFNSQVTALGSNATQVFNEIKKASGGLIDNNALLQSANTALSLGIDISVLGDMMEVARAKARDMGITTQESFEKLTIALARGSKLRLDDLGIIVNTTEANERYAASIDTTVAKLTAQDKALAFNVEALRLGAEALERYNLEQNTLAENMQEFKATMTNVRIEMGAFFLRLGTFGLSVLQDGQDVMLRFAGTIMQVGLRMAELTDRFGITENAALSWQIQITASMEAADEASKKARNNADLAFTSTADLLKAQTDALKRPAPITAGKDEEAAALKAAEEKKASIEVEIMKRRFRFAVADNKARKALDMDRLKTAASISNSLVTISGNSSRKLFGINKALALGQIATDTSRAVVAALASPPGPPFTIPTAIKVGLIGAAKGAQVAGMSFGGGGGGGAAPSIGGGGAASPAAPATPVAAPISEIGLTVRVIADGPQEGSIVSKVITEFEDAFSDGRVNLNTVKVGG